MTKESNNLLISSLELYPVIVFIGIITWMYILSRTSASELIWFNDSI